MPFKIKILLSVLCFLIYQPIFSFAGKVDLPRTGQTTCYNSSREAIECDGTGQDGDIQAGVEWPDPRFADNGNGTITDNLTGLIWLKNPSCMKWPKVNWDSAMEFVNGLANGSCGLTDGSIAGDWRLPNLVELESLVNLAVEGESPAEWLNNQGFTNVQSSEYWSSTTRTYYSGFSFLVGMNYGQVYHGIQFYEDYYFWPVRAGQTGTAETWQTGQKIVYANRDDGDIQAGMEWPEPRFNDNGDGTVTDKLTGLVWLKNANAAGTATRDQALEFCNNLSSGTHGLTDGSVAGDWRLPNRKELFSLIDYSQNSPSLPQDNPFENVQVSDYWTSTNLGYGSILNAWVINMEYGFVRSSYDKDPYVWPVRTGHTDSDAIIDFGSGTGLWARYNNTSWTKLHSLSPEIIATGDLDGNGQDDCVIDFGSGIGIYVLYNNTTWTKLHGLSAEIIATGDLDGNGKDDCIIDFGSGVGIYVRYNDQAWAKLHSLSPEIIKTGDLDGSGEDDCVIDFGSGIGVYVFYNNTLWTKLHSSSPEIMTIGDLDGSGQDDCIMDFGSGVGTYVRYNNTAWTKLHSLSPEIITAGDLDGNGEDECILDFGSGTGIWIRYNNTSWTKRHSLSPEIIETGDLDSNGEDEIIIDFGAGIGVYVYYKNASWTKLHSLSPESINTGNLDNN
ncbi:MAG: DUF1566 domain-containing protein [Acidobacteria bacterium]|nr:DUF1566 domain-containing protein [Acidobacteriota bacterium]